MSLDLTKAPWPEALQAQRKSWHFGCIALDKSEYAFARHRVNLFEELLAEVEAIANGVAAMPPGLQLPDSLQKKADHVRSLVHQARKGP